MDRIELAFTKANRADFVPEEVRGQAASDAPVSIGFGQTNSQPSTVRMMLEWLDPQPGDRVLDIGSGSGWTTALLAHLVGSQGEVFATEKIPELVDFGRRNCDKTGVKNAWFFQSGSVLGLPDYAPFDRIMVSASAERLPEELAQQLKLGGTMVIPVRRDVLVVTKGDSDLDITTHLGFLFVPLL